MQSITENFLNAFEMNTEAIATNRGFYYQHLLVLMKWVQHFIDGNETSVATEVDEDIKEVGENLIFTQVKCYSSSFSFQSDGIRKTLFHFFMLYMKNKQLIHKQEFHFETNSYVSRREKLLSSWVQNPDLDEEGLLQNCIHKVKEILLKEVKQRKNKKLEQAGITEDSKAEIRMYAEQFKLILEHEQLELFVKSIRWRFHLISPEQAIHESFKAVTVLLRHEKFGSKLPNMLIHVLLSEIFKRSQLASPSDRVVNNALLQSILDKTDKELSSLVHRKFVHLIGVRMDQLQADFDRLQDKQLQQQEDIDTIKQSIHTLNTGQTPPDRNLARELTLMPFFSPEEFYGREDELAEVDKLVSSTRMVAIHGEGGSGKTAFVLQYLSHFEERFSYVIWLSPDPSLVNSVVFNVTLIRNLNLDLIDGLSIDQKFTLICNEVGRLPGKIAWVIDDLSISEELNKVRLLASLKNSIILITTQHKLQEFPNYHLRELGFEEASRIFHQYITEDTDEQLLKQFLDHIHYNPLLIELSCKLIKNSIGLDLKQFYTYLKDQKLDSQELLIDVHLMSESESVQIFSFLQKVFRISELDQKEKHYLEIFSLFPSGEMTLPEIVAICGIEFEEQNKVTFANIVNSLERKGWLERDKKILRMHRIIQELLLYESRKGLAPFAGSWLIINWLFRRMNEALQTNPSGSLPYFKYAESVLRSIKEEYRNPFYQPLLLLENELLFGYDTLALTAGGHTHHRWVDLVSRAEKHLSPIDHNLGIMYNNLAISYARQGDYKLSASFARKSVDILKTWGEKYLLLLMKLYGNLFSAYLAQNQFQEASQVLKESLEFHKRYKRVDNPLTSIHYNTLGVMYQKLGQIKSAIGLFEKAIKAHFATLDDTRNEKELAMFYSNLAFAYFQLGIKEKAIEHQLLVVAIYERMALLHLLANAYDLLALMYEEINDIQTANALREKLSRL